MRNKFIFITTLLLLFPTASFAEEVVQEPVVTPEPAYTPPPEAYEGTGGWAVVDPNTGTVHGVIVCTADVCGPQGSWGGKMPVDYMGCSSGCDLRFQTQPSEDGNVAGYHGDNVQYNQESQDFSMTNTYETEEGTVERKDTISPSSSSPITKTETTLKSKKKQEQSVKVEVVEEKVEVSIPEEDNTILEKESVSVTYEEWNGNTSFFYDSKVEALESIESDVESIFTPCETCNVDEQQVEEYRNTWYDTISSLTTTVKNFLSRMMGQLW